MNKYLFLLVINSSFAVAAQQPSTLRLSVYTREGSKTQTLKTKEVDIPLNYGQKTVAETEITTEDLRLIRVNVVKDAVKDRISYSVRIAAHDKSGRKLCASKAYTENMESFLRVQANCGDIAKGLPSESIQLVLDNPSMPH